MKKTVITTPRLILRAMTEKDENAMLELLTDPIVGKTYMIPEFTSREAARPLFHKIMEHSVSDRFVYGVYFENDLIGFVNDVEKKEKTIELGYAYLPKYYNQGFATEALLACIDTLFKAGFETVRTGAFSENLASMRVMEKAGMTRCPDTEIIEYRGKEHLCLYYERAHNNISEIRTFCL